MTLLSRLLALFPAFIVGLTGLSLVWMCSAHSFFVCFLRLWLALFSLYGLPLLIYRLHNLRWPVSEGISYLKSDQYSPWWGSHQIQAVYLALPSLERTLRLIPGAFSLWLRLWGSTIGKQVYWTPELEIADRGLLIVGDRAVIGQGVGLYSHIIKPKKADLLLYIKRIHIGSNTFIGAWSKLGPGAAVANEAYLPVGTHRYPNQKKDLQTQTQKSETAKCDPS